MFIISCPSQTHPLLIGKEKTMENGCISPSSHSYPSKRWRSKKKQKEEEEYRMRVNNKVKKKRVMVVIDQTTRAKHAMMYALTHVVNKGDIITLLQVIAPHQNSEEDCQMFNLADSLASLCKACKPEAEVEALVMKGPKLSTVLSQIKKLDVSVLVLGQAKPSTFCCLFKTWDDNFAEQCIERAECVAMAVKKQSKGVSGYLISTKWQKNFWVLA